MEKNKEKVKNFVSLDDDFGEEHYKKHGLGGHLVQTLFYTHDVTKGGIQDKHVKKSKRDFRQKRGISLFFTAATKNKRTDEINEETDKSNPEEFKDITDEAIDNTWYVKMLKAMVPKEEKEAKKK